MLIMAQDLSSLLKEGIIIARLHANSRKQVLCEMAEAMARKLKLDTRDIFEAIMERERLGSTGVGSGVAIPHARIEGLDRTVGGFVRLEQAVDFDAVDEKPCDLIFMLLAPHAAGADHLRALAKVSRAFRQAEVRQALREARTESDVLAVLCPGGERAPSAA